MATRRPTTSGARTKSDDATLVNILISAVLALVALLVIGGYWMQKQRSNDAVQYHQATVYENYLHQTSTASRPVELPREFIQAQETRRQLLAHPAVQPGEGFDKPGVQATGKAIVDAIDHAKGL